MMPRYTIPRVAHCDYGAKQVKDRGAIMPPKRMQYATVLHQHCT